ncbi:hypothetical protein [Pedobacter caeni]|uniref:Translation elongation factor EFTu/EF1A C-terminal domain-containing protein n=1 Tax=Pedobacter caeni TaxID=288992 RepID=A0A1M5JQ80_9SPHI|nr:hypothetical protein [Pedobacter caeni]SHG42565.1 hypothetical protein SAMN04488522_105462 [Pedobacter caeni]
MEKLFKIKAEIKVDEKSVRTWPIKNGYRPGFNFINESQTSGSIKLLEKDSLKPGDLGRVEISFVSDALLGKIDFGTEFKFYEGRNEIGKGKVLQILGWLEHCNL